MSALRGCFVTGTDTEVGKTQISTALLTWLQRQGLRAAGYKPVASGMEVDAQGRWYNDDVRRMQAVSPSSVGHYLLKTACAPHIAARLEGVALERAAVWQRAQQLQSQVQVLVAEGAGGVHVPLGVDWDSADMMADLGLPVVLVVGLRLGCINHATLSAQAVRLRGLHLAGWVGNQVGVQPMAYQTENIATLQQLMQQHFNAPCLGIVPHLQAGQQAVDYLNSTMLHQLFQQEQA